ncbi:MAG: EamA family transporter [Frankiales bacterium]|nr:EamA family transporter [Frankiales bacterium]
MTQRASVAQRAPAPLLVIGAVVSVQSGAAIATRLFPDIGPGGTVFLRIGLSALLLLAVARPRLCPAAASHGLLAVAYGLVLAGMNATFYEALSRIPLGIAVTFEFVGPLGVAVWGSRRRLDIVWVALAAIGVALLTSGGGRDVDGLGVALALVAGAFWAAYILLAQRVGRVYPGAAGLAIALAVGAVVLAPFGILAGGTALVHPSVLWRGAAVAVLSSALPYSLELYALRTMRTTVFGVLMSLEPALAALSGLVFLGQRLSLREWVAVGCVMAASIGATRRAPPETAPLEPGATPCDAVAGVR